MKPVKYRYAVATILTLCILTVTAVAIAQEVPHDGYWWNKIPAGSRPAFITGVSDGIVLGEDLACAHLADKHPGERGAVNIIANSFAEVQEKYLSHVSIEQLVHELNKFYFNSRNKPILVSDAIYIIVNRTAGLSDSDYARLVDEYRRKMK